MLRRALSNLAMVAIFAVAALMLVPAALGYHRYVILTGSMTGTYDAGSIVFDRPVPTSALKAGDPITYAPPPGASPNHALVTHRIHAVTTLRDGRRVYVTKGDANARPDPWKFTLPQATQDTVRFHVPYAGYVFMVLGVPQFRMALIGLPALLVALWIVGGMWREGGELERRRRAGVQPWPDDVGRLLPALAPLGEGDPAAGRITVQVPVSWARAAPDPRRDRAAGPRRRPATVAPATAPSGRVPLPSGCVAAARRRGPATPHPLPRDWRLRVRPALAR